MVVRVRSASALRCASLSAFSARYFSAASPRRVLPVNSSRTVSPSSSSQSCLTAWMRGSVAMPRRAPVDDSAGTPAIAVTEREAAEGSDRHAYMRACVNRERAGTAATAALGAAALMKAAAQRARMAGATAAERIWPLYCHCLREVTAMLQVQWVCVSGTELAAGLSALLNTATAAAEGEREASRATGRASRGCTSRTHTDTTRYVAQLHP